MELTLPCSKCGAHVVGKTRAIVLMVPLMLMLAVLPATSSSSSSLSLLSHFSLSLSSSSSLSFAVKTPVAAFCSVIVRHPCRSPIACGVGWDSKIKSRGCKGQQHMRFLLSSDSIISPRPDSVAASRSTAATALFSSPSTASSGSQAETNKTHNKSIENTTTKTTETNEQIFHKFATFLLAKQHEIISTLEQMDGSGETFTADQWGTFANSNNQHSNSALITLLPLPTNKGAGGITRVLQNGQVIEKGACSITLIRKGILTAERAASIRERATSTTTTNNIGDEPETLDTNENNIDINEGDSYSAAALSIVLHARSPMIPTFRSDVRIFLVTKKEQITKHNQGDEEQHNNNKSMAFFGGGADLTPNYLFDSDITEFHTMYRNLCHRFFPPNHDLFSYQQMKRACDAYFYLPARSEHRGTGGIFFDDMVATSTTLQFVQGVADTWMKSWVPIVQRRRDMPYTQTQRQWQLLRRGRYLEFNLLYDRGVKFGLANANPRVEGIMVSAPPLVAWEYNHPIEVGSEEERLMKVLKHPKEWVLD